MACVEIVSKKTPWPIGLTPKYYIGTSNSAQPHFR